MDQELEVWKNAGTGNVAVKVFDIDGRNPVSKFVRPGREVMLTTRERAFLNSDRVSDDSLDPFSNGQLIPVTLAETSEDITEAPEANPNHVSNDDLADLFQVRNYMQFKSAVNKIDAVPTLRRLLALAEDDDVDARSSQVGAINDRLAELDPSFAETLDPAAEVEVVATSMSEDEKRVGALKFEAERGTPEFRPE